MTPDNDDACQGSPEPSQKWDFATRAIHRPGASKNFEGALNPPVFLSATFAFDTAEQGAARFAGQEEGMIYSRVANPTVLELEKRIADLEGAEAALCAASGMGAIATLLWTYLRPGDEALFDLTLYGGTHDLAQRILPQFGIKVTFADFTNLGDLASHLNAATRLVYFESPANPNMRLIDIAGVCKVVNGSALVAVDNTYCSPYLQRPIELGADFSLHSLTKYMNGHGDVIAGAIAGKQEAIETLRLTGIKDITGACLAPMEAYLVMRGLKTLPVRMERHCATAQQIAEWLEAHPKVKGVFYPGLKSHSQHDLAKRQMRLPGAMIAAEFTGGVQAVTRFINSLELWTRAVSLGDAESLVEHPASMTHANLSVEERAKHLLSDGLVRLSVGLESPTDLIADLDQALRKL